MDFTTLIYTIKKESSGCTIAIEGEGAYDNVDHSILNSILEKRIADTKFLKFLNQRRALRALDRGITTDTISGVPQGSILVLFFCLISTCLILINILNTVFTM